MTDEHRYRPQTAVGTPRSADSGDGVSEPTVQHADPAISAGARTRAHPTEEQPGPNRSGSGGSGGPGTGGEGQEGSTGQSMDELLTGESGDAQG